MYLSPLVITGTPKSGMAVFSGCLRIMGYNSLQTDSGMDASIINGKLMQDLGCKDPWPIGTLPSGWMNSDAAKQAHSRIEKLIDFSVTGAKYPMPFFMTDSLFAVTLPLWQKVFENKGFCYDAVYMIRHPHEVVNSINVKNNLDPGQLYLRWLYHVRTFVYFVAQSDNYVLMTYDQLVADPVNAMSCFFIPENDKNSACSLKVSKRLKYDLNCLLLSYVQAFKKHHHFRKTENQELDTFEPFFEYYDQVRRTAQSQMDLTSTEFSASLSSIRKDYQKIMNDKLNPLLRGLKDPPRGNWGVELLDAVLHHAVSDSKQLSIVFNEHAQPLYDERKMDRFEAKIYYESSPEGLKEARCFPLIENQWQKITMEILDGYVLAKNGMRISPLNTNGIVWIASVTFTNSTTGAEICSYKSEERFKLIKIVDDVIRLYHPSTLLLMITGTNALFVIPLVENVPDCPIKFEIWLKATRDQRFVNNYLINKTERMVLSELEYISDSSSDFKKKLYENKVIQNECNKTYNNMNTIQFSFVKSSILSSYSKKETPVQIFVLGMHRSGTSAITGLLNKMGVYTSTLENTIPADENNRKGYWERWDVNKSNEQLFHKIGASWCKVSKIDLHAIDREIVNDYKEIFYQILNELNKHNVWVLKDPRMCILFPLLKDMLQSPIIIHIYRNPVEVAASLNKRDGIPLAAGLALWELYNAHALNASRGLQKIILSYNDLVANRISITKELYSIFSAFTDGLVLPSEFEIEAIIDRKLYRNRSHSDYYSLTVSQLLILNKFKRFDYLNNDYPSIKPADISLAVLEDFENSQSGKF